MQLPPEVEQFAKDARLHLLRYSGPEIIAEAESLPSTSRQIFWLARWASINSRNPEAADVVEYALEKLIRSSDYAPNVGALRRLSSPLPHILDKPRKWRMLTMMESLVPTIQDAGPTEEVIQLRLNLTVSLADEDEASALNRLIDLYLTISAMSDPVQRATCLAKLVTALSVIDNDAVFDGDYKLKSQATEDVLTSTALVLGSTADHDDIAKPIVAALARNCPLLAVTICRTYNTEYRRDWGLLGLIYSHMDQPADRVDGSALRCALDEIADPFQRDRALMTVAKQMAEWESLADGLFDDLRPIIAKMTVISDAYARAAACIDVGTLLGRCGPLASAPLRDSMFGVVAASLPQIDIEWNRQDLNFRAAARFASIDRELATEYLKAAENLRASLPLASEPLADDYLAYVRLAIRSHSGLLHKRLDTDSNNAHIEDLIRRVPSAGEKAKLWGNVALNLKRHGRSDECSKVVSKNVKPLYNAIADTDGTYRAHIAVSIAPALYVAHQSSALDIINQLTGDERDEALYHICRYLVTGQTFAEPFEAAGEPNGTLTPEVIEDLCSLMERIECDAYIFWVAKALTGSLFRGRKDPRYTAQLRETIIARIKSVAATKLHNRRFIVHDGYAIAISACILHAKGGSVQDWEALLARARLIPNASDRTLVLGMLVGYTKRHPAFARRVIAEARQEAAKILCMEDKAHRLHALAEEALEA